VNGIVFLAIALVVSVLGSLTLWLNHRDPTSLDHGIDEFRREMRALSPNRVLDSRPSEPRSQEQRDDDQAHT
jgi:hypothetical protein